MPAVWTRKERAARWPSPAQVEEDKTAITPGQTGTPTLSGVAPWSMRGMRWPSASVEITGSLAATARTCTVTTMRWWWRGAVEAGVGTVPTAALMP